jgi:hypothetical protein
MIRNSNDITRLIFEPLPNKMADDSINGSPLECK